MNKVYLIGNAHIDPVWLWNWQEGFAEVRSTFRSALDRMKEFKDFKFTSACSAYYMWIEKCDSEMFKEIQERVKEGRWCITGGMFVQPDCNIPSGESFARHALVSQRYFKEKFGLTAKIGYNVDSFGHNANMPQILKNSGMNSYTFMRPYAHEKELPSHLFDWESVDGSRVRACRIPFYYNIDLSSFSAFYEIEKLAEQKPAMAFYGVGNHGGGPTVRLLNEMNKRLGDNFVYSTPDEYFDDTKEIEVDTIKGELQDYSKGCYSAHHQTKATNRKAENMMYSAEVSSLISAKLVNAEYPSGEYTKAWRNILFNQFHDIICGTSIRETYEDSANMYGESMSIAKRETFLALSQISWNIDTIGNENVEIYKNGGATAAWRNIGESGTPVVIFNPLPFWINEIINVRDLPTCVTDNAGNLVPSQRVRDSKTKYDEKHKNIFLASVPPMGYSVYRLHFNNEAAMKTSVKALNYVIENDILKVSFDRISGEICEVLDKKSDRYIIKSSSYVVLKDDDSDTWGHDVSCFGSVSEKAELLSIKVTENGPVRATIRTIQKVGNTEVIRDYSLVHGSDEINVHVKVDFHDKHKILKIGIPLNSKNCRAYCDIPFGFEEVEANGVEHVTGSWVAISGESSTLGVVTDSVYAFDACDNVLSLTLLRGCMYAEHMWNGDFGRDEFCEYMEQGEHEFDYRIFPYTSPSDAAKRGQRLNCMPVNIVETFHKGDLNTSFSAIDISAENIVVTALKKHEDSDAYVLRCYEADNVPVRVKFCVFDTEFEANFRNNEIKTFVIKDGQCYETDFIE